MKQSGLAPILIILLIGFVVAAIAGGAYFFGFDQGWEKSVKSQPN